MTHNSIKNNLGNQLELRSAGIVIENVNSDKHYLTISRNDIHVNLNGIELMRSPDTRSISIENNNISGNRNYAVYVANNRSGEDISMPNNWWGTTDAAVIDSQIHDYNDNQALSLQSINYQPIAISEIPNAGVR